MKTQVPLDRLRSETEAARPVDAEDGYWEDLTRSDFSLGFRH